jgi:hypothetical protein
MQATQQSNKIVFTKDQSLEIEKFEKELEAGNVEFNFEGSLLEGKAYLEGIVNITQTVNP